MSREEQVKAAEALADFERNAQREPDVIHELREDSADLLGYESSLGLSVIQAQELVAGGWIEFEQVVVQYSIPAAQHTNMAAVHEAFEDGGAL